MTEHDAPPSKHPRDVQRMFGRIVGRYDRLNRLISLGMDTGWRRAAADAAAPAGRDVLDIGTGTGDLLRMLCERGARRVVGLDFTPDMLAVAHERAAPLPTSQLVAGDALRLPFHDSSFDRVTNAFVLRNLSDLPAAFAEMARVLRPEGRLVCLDMTKQSDSPFAALFRLYFNRIVPPIAGLVAGDRAAYRYLPRSLEGFPDAEEMSYLVAAAGFRDVRVRRFGGGSVATHVATK